MVEIPALEQVTELAVVCEQPAPAVTAAAGSEMT